jgi:hypothetical protein
MKVLILVILLLFSAASYGLDYGRLVFIRSADSLMDADFGGDRKFVDLDTVDLNKYLLVPEQANTLRYKQGGLCLFFDCKINPNNAFVAIVKPWNDWVVLRNFASSTTVSKYDDSTHLYIYKRVLPGYENFYYSYKSFKKDSISHFAKLKEDTDYWLKKDIYEKFQLPSCRMHFNAYTLNKIKNEERRIEAERDPFDRDKTEKKYEDFENINNNLSIEKKLIYARKNKLCYDYSLAEKASYPNSYIYLFYFNPAMQFCYISDEFNNITKKELFKTIKKNDIAMVYKNDNFWDTLIQNKRGESLASLKRCFCDECHSQSCPIEPANGIVRIDTCRIYSDSTLTKIYKKGPCAVKQETPLIYCEERLSCAQEEYDILYHIGPFAGDCDLSNWRGIKLKDLSKEELEQFKKRYYWWEE